MTQSRDVASNIQQTAQDIIDHLLTYRDDVEKGKLQIELDNLLKLAREEYAGDASTTLSLFKQYFIFPFTRQRHSQLEQAIHSLQGCSEEQFARFIILIDLLKAGGACKATSLNSLILDKLITATGKYHPITEDRRLDATSLLSNDARINIREILKNTLIEKAIQLIEQRAIEKSKQEQEKLALRKINQVPPKRLAITQSLIDELDAMLKGKKSKQKPTMVVHKLDKHLLVERHAMLKEKLGQRGKPAQLGGSRLLTEANETLKPLKVSFEETTVEALKQPVSDHKRLRANPDFAASLINIGTFFAAKKYKMPEQVNALREDIFENKMNF